MPALGDAAHFSMARFAREGLTSGGATKAEVPQNA